MPHAATLEEPLPYIDNDGKLVLPGRSLPDSRGREDEDSQGSNEYKESTLSPPTAASRKTIGVTPVSPGRKKTSPKRGVSSNGGRGGTKSTGNYATIESRNESGKGKHTHALAL